MWSADCIIFGEYSRGKCTISPCCSPLSPRPRCSTLSPRPCRSPLSPRPCCSPLSPRPRRSPLSPRPCCSPLSPRPCCSPLSPRPFAKPHLRCFSAASQLALLIVGRLAHKRIISVHCVQAPMPSAYPLMAELYWKLPFGSSYAMI